MIVAGAHGRGRLLTHSSQETERERKKTGSQYTNILPEYIPNYSFLPPGSMF
jgi:hypothetical protein